MSVINEIFYFKLKRFKFDSSIIFAIFIIGLVFSFMFCKRLKLLSLTDEDALTFDQKCPVIFDNDDPRDTYTEEYLMALASAGSIQLKGIITSSSIAPYNRWVPEEDYEHFISLRANIYDRAVQSGFKNIPTPVRGVKGNLVRPSSGKIEDTAPSFSVGGMLIRDEARKATTKKPLVVIVGGALSAIADAYLMDSSIAGKMVVMFLDCSDDYIENGYNAWVDGWASVITFKKLNVIRYRSVGHDTKDYDPAVPKSRILFDLPDTPLRAVMFEKKHPTNPLPDERDADCPPAIHFMRHDYAKNARRQCFSHEVVFEDHIVPALKDDPNGNILFFTSMNKDIASEEWWRAMQIALKR